MDPRSLMQGDHMVLGYAVSRKVGLAESPRQGLLVLQLDADGVGHFVRQHTPDTPLAPGELLLGDKERDGRVRLGAESFFFQDGHAGWPRTAPACWWD